MLSTGALLTAFLFPGVMVYLSARSFKRAHVGNLRNEMGLTLIQTMEQRLPPLPKLMKYVLTLIPALPPQKKRPQTM
jgi:hypothetical protein